MAIDFDRLKRENDIVDVVGRHISLQKKGSEYYGICPFHDDTHKSLQVNSSKQLFKCFACGAGGDVFDFYKHYGKTIQEAAELLGQPSEAMEVGADKRRKARKPIEKVTWTPITPIPQGAPEPPATHYRHGAPSLHWTYRDASGLPTGYILRFDTEDGKEVLPLTYCTDGKRTEWRFQGFGYPRPIYGLDRLAAHPDRTVIIVEGEKCADAINAHMDTAVGIAWPGGAQAIKHVDWAPLAGRRIILWPDNDAPGTEAMHTIAEHLRPNVPVMKWLKPPASKPPKWDVADEQWQAGELREFVKQHIGPVPPVTPEPPSEPTPPPPPPPAPDPAPVPPELPPLPDEPEDEYHAPSADNPYFRFLGYINDDGRPLHCFYPVGNKIIVKLTTSRMSVSSLMDLAPLTYWENLFPTKAKAKFDIDAATNWLSSVSQQFGIFSPKNIRGRGAWSDEGRTVVHSGTHMMVDGKHTRLGDLKTRYIYEIGETLGFPTSKPLPATEAAKLVDVLKLLNWERDVNSYLLAGWCVVAPICGALNWRPHIWITGSAGTGKSWVFKEIVRRLLGETCFAVQGETTEAGLRQSLRHDALPVVFDEAEAEDRKSQERIQTVLTLMRAASADDGGLMAKGSANGNAVTFRIRSCFAFASIGMSLSQQSDRSRVTILGLKRLPDGDPQRLARWKELQAMHHAIMTDDFITRLQARTLSMVPVILDNAKTFSAAAAAVIGAQRTGDQLGAMLAGAYSLFSGKRISYDDAVQWVSDKDWNEERALDQTRDEIVLFSHLMEHITSVETGGGLKVDRQVGELVQLIASKRFDSSELVPMDMAHARLRRLGFKVDEGYIVISNCASEVKKILANTPWSKNHARILKRIEGAREYGATNFAAGMKERAIGVPLSLLGS